VLEGVGIADIDRLRVYHLDRPLQGGLPHFLTRVNP